MKKPERTPLIRLIVTKNDGTVSKAISYQKRRILSKVMRALASEWTLEVIYLPGVGNAGTYRNKDLVTKVLSDWTSKDQLDFVYDGEWE